MLLICRLFLDGIVGGGGHGRRRHSGQAVLFNSCP